MSKTWEEYKKLMEYFPGEMDLRISYQKYLDGFAKACSQPGEWQNTMKAVTDFCEDSPTTVPYDELYVLNILFEWSEDHGKYKGLTKEEIGHII